MRYGDLVLGIALLGAGCAPIGPPASPPTVQPILTAADVPVIYPPDPCASSTQTVFTDERGAFLGGLAPGEATVLHLADGVRTVRAVSTAEVVASPGTWFSIEEIRVTPRPAGLLLRPGRWNARQCPRTGFHAITRVLTPAERTAALSRDDVRWYAPSVAAGQAWLARYQPRIDEMLAYLLETEPSASLVVRRTRIP